MIKTLMVSIGAAAAFMLGRSITEIILSADADTHDPLTELAQEVKTLREDNKQLRSLVQMQALTPFTIPSHLRARDMGDDTWWLTTDTNHWFVMIGTNGSKIILQHK